MTQPHVGIQFFQQELSEKPPARFKIGDAVTKAGTAAVVTGVEFSLGSRISLPGWFYRIVPFDQDGDPLQADLAREADLERLEPLPLTTR